MNGFELCKQLRRQLTPQKKKEKKRAGWKMAQAKSVKKSHSEEKRSPTLEKAVILSSKWNKTTMKNSWVDKDLRKSTKKKCFEENGAV